MLSLPKNKKRLFLLSGIAGFLLVIWLFWKVPQYGIPSSVTDDKDRAELLNDNRESIIKVLQTIGGLGFIATAYLAWRNFQLTEDKNVSERFSKAVEMLANKEQIEVRLGGIYSLERIARDSKEDHKVVMEVLTAFVRSKTISKEYEEYMQSQQPKTFMDPMASWAYALAAEFVKTSQHQPDIQSALTVIGRRIAIAPLSWRNELSEIKLDLRLANLSGADLSGADLRQAQLIGSRLIKTNLSGANLSGANLRWADLSGADLSNANLSRTRLGEADLSDTKLNNTNFSETELSNAKLNNAYLNNTNLSQAIIWGTELRGTNLRQANLKDAIIIATDLQKPEALPEDQLCGTSTPKKAKPLICNVLLPSGLKVEGGKDRDCSAITPILVERYSDEYTSEYIQDEVKKSQEKTWDSDI